MFPNCLIVSCVVVVSSGLNPPQEGVAPLRDAEQCLRAIQDPDTRVRQQAIKDFARLDVVSTEIIMQIVQICKSSRDETARDALMALESLGAKATPAIPFLTGVLLNGEYPQNYFAGRALAAMGAAAAPAIPFLMKAVHSTRASTRAMGAEALGGIGADAEVAVPVLFEMAIHDKGGGWVWSVEDKARRALTKIGAPAVPLLLGALTSKDDRRREIAADVLYRMTLESRNNALSAKAILKKSLRDKNANVRVHTALAYWNLSHDVENVRPLLLSVIKEYVQDRDRSLAAGKSTGLPPREVEAAVIGLRHLGEDAAPAIELLVDILAHTTGGLLDLHTVETLGELGTVARPAIPRLEQMSTSPDGRMRQAVNKALQSITSVPKMRVQGQAVRSTGRIV